MKKPPLSRLLPLLGLLIIAAAFLLKKHLSGPSFPSGLPTTGGSPMTVQIAAPPFLQWDTRWSDEKLGQSEEKIGATGCTLCAVSMAINSQGFKNDPASLNKLLIKNGGYTTSGLLIWGSLPAVTKGQFGVQVADHPTYEVIDRQLAQGNPVIAKVLFGDAIWHWVLICGKQDKQYLINDPLGSGPSHQDMANYPKGIFAVRFLQRL
ncbi:hypothetical protein BH09VER1_BH09VER1_54660 [soil metagenome]